MNATDLINSGIGTIFGKGFDFAANMLMTSQSNHMAAERERQARAENYKYGEMAADNANYRTMQLYNKLYSPQAQLGQLKDAGLSPSLFYGDGGGISGQSGAMGTGAGSVSPNVFGYPMTNFGEVAKQAAEIEALKAQTKNTEADTDKKKAETKNVDLENARKELENSQYKDTFEILNQWYATEDGKDTSIFEIAEKSSDFNEFLDRVRKASKESTTSDEYNNIRRIMTTENGLKTLREIYTASAKLPRDVAAFVNEQVSAEFAIKVTNALKNSNYANQNAKTLVNELKARDIEATLTDQQKGAFERIIKRYEDGNAKDLIIVLLTLADKAMKDYR